MPWTTLALWCQLLGIESTRGRANANSHGGARYLKARFSNPCCRSIRRGGYSKTVAAIRSVEILRTTGAMPDRNRSLWDLASLGTRTAGVRPSSKTYAAKLREALREGE